MSLDLSTPQKSGGSAVGWIVVTGLLCLSLAGSVVLNVVLINGVSHRQELRERQLANHQAVLAAIVASGRVRASDLRPLLEPQFRWEPHTYDGVTTWVVDDPGRKMHSSEYPETSVSFDEAGRMQFVGAYKP